MSAEEIIQRIVSKYPHISREKILSALDEEKSKSSGLIADVTLLRLIAARHDVETMPEAISNRTLSTKILVPQLYDVTISGRIIATYPLKTFEGKKPGKFASLTISDKYGILRVMLWNDKANLLESGSLKTGQIVRFSHAYTREDRNGNTELHLGEKSNVEINPEDLSEDCFPSLEETAIKINQINEAEQTVCLIGKVEDSSGLSTFTRQDQTSGKLLRFTLADETGIVAVIVWNEKAEELAKTLKKNASVRLVNARVKTNSGHQFELQVDAATYLEVSDQ